MSRSSVLKKKVTILPFIIVLFIVLSISISYTYFYSSFRNGSMTSIYSLTKNGDVHFENVSNITKVGNATDNGRLLHEAKIVEKEYTPSDVNDDKTVNFAVSLKKPGDKYQFQVRIVNDSSEKKNVRLTTTPIPYKDSSYAKWNITGIDLEEGELFKPGDSKLITLSVEYDGNVSMEKSIDVNLSAVVTTE